jgi:hypothetical protein
LIQGEFFILSFSCSFCFGFELFLTLLFGLPLFVLSVDFTFFLLLDDPL